MNGDLLRYDNILIIDTDMSDGGSVSYGLLVVTGHDENEKINKIMNWKDVM